MLADTIVSRVDTAAIGILGAVATVFAVLVTHWLGQRRGKERADQVREELSARLNAIDSRLTEIKGDLKSQISETKADSIVAINQARTDLQGSTIRLEARIESMKEMFALELRASKAEILAALPQRVHQAGGSETNG